MKKGFTLLELLTVALIVAVLAAVAIPAYNGYINRAADQVCQHTASMVIKSVIVYVQNKGDIPAATYDLAGINAVMGDYGIKLPSQFTANVIVLDSEHITVIVEDIGHAGTATIGT